MICFAVRIFCRVGTRLLENSLQVRYFNVIKRALAGTLTIAFPLIVVKVLYHFMVPFVKGKNELFRTRHAGRAQT